MTGVQTCALPIYVVVYGGAAGGGKSFGLLMEPLRHMDNPQFRGVIFRRTSPQLVGAGSLWDEAQGLYHPIGAKMRATPHLSVTFPSGASIQFLHLQRKADVLQHQGKQYAFVAFDELTHFEESQWWYLLSRMRSVSGVKPYMRCTTNPRPDHFVRKLIDWWIGEDGLPIPERSGVLRWFARVAGELHWADTKEELEEMFQDYGEEIKPMSFTFIAASLDDNEELMKKDPSYRSKLLALPEVERKRLLLGDWNAMPAAGKYVNRDMFQRRWKSKKDLPPMNIYTAADFAVKEKEDENDDPDFTEIGVFGVTADDDLYVLDWWYGQTRSDVWIEKLVDLWEEHEVQVAWGEGGVIRRAIEPALHQRMEERGTVVDLEWKNPVNDKPTRGRSFQARAAMGKIVFPQHAPWASRVIEQCHAFVPKSNLHDDAFDTMAWICLAIDELDPAHIKPKKEFRKRRRWDEPVAKAGWKTV